MVEFDILGHISTSINVAVKKLFSPSGAFQGLRIIILNQSSKGIA